MTHPRITFIGAGNMAASLIGGLRAQGVAAEDITVCPNAIGEAFLAEPFSEDERHVRRIGKIAHYETTGEVLM